MIFYIIKLPGFPSPGFTKNDIITIWLKLISSIGCYINLNSFKVSPNIA